VETCSIGIDDGTGETPTTVDVGTLDGSLDQAITTYEGDEEITTISVDGTFATKVKDTTTGLEKLLGAIENQEVGGAETEFAGVI
jgi:hypothetical protein